MPSIWVKIFPSGFRNELYQFLEIYFPIIATSTSLYLNPIISMIMCGHLSKVEFDAASLANSLINILGISIELGFATAADTLFAQIYGSEQKKKMGSILQKSLVVMTLIYLLLVIIHLNIEPILIFLKQDPLISELTALYMTLFLPGLYFEFSFMTISRYLQSQNIVYPMMISAFCGNVFNTVTQWIALYVLNFKLQASAILQGITSFVMFSLQLRYILISQVYKDTWNGFSTRDCLENWKILFVLGIPGIFMVTLEEWNFEIATVIAGTINSVQLGAQSIAFQSSTFCFMLTIGLLISTSIRVGQCLGAGDIDGVKTSYRTAIVIGTVSSSISCLLILTLRKYITALFSTDREIQEDASRLLIYIAFMQFPGIIVGITSGILKGCGRQLFGAVIMFISYYIVGMPVGIILVFLANINIQGMWIGLITALCAEGIVFSIYIICIDWKAECERAMKNINEVNYEEFTLDQPSEKSPFIIKSHDENDMHRITKNVHYSAEKTVNRNRKISESITVPDEHSKPFCIDSDQPFVKIIIKRIITIIVVLVLVLGAIMMRIYLPKSLYLPCIEKNAVSLQYYQKNYYNFCNATGNVPNVAV